MARILILSPFLPHPNILHAGGQWLYHLLKDMPHEYHLLCYGRGESPEMIDAAKSVCASVTIVQPSYTLRDKLRQVIRDGWRHPLRLGRRTFFEMCDHIHTLCKKHHIDLIHLCWTEMGAYIDHLPQNIPVILHTHDVEHIVRRREVDLQRLDMINRVRIEASVRTSFKMAGNLSRRATRLIDIERRAIPRSDAVIAASAFDKKHLSSLTHPERIFVMPPYVDSESLLRIEPESGIRGHLVYFGALDRFANAAAARFLMDDVFPLVQNQHPEAHLIIAGANPPLELKDSPGITVTGCIDDIPALWQSAQIAVLPSFIGGGMLVKVMQALYAARPVVTTPYGNEGTNAPVITATDGASFADAVLYLLTKPTEREKLALTGRTHAIENFNWQKLLQSLELAYEKVKR